MSDNLTDWELAERIRTGDEASFSGIMDRYKHPVTSFIYRMIGDAGTAQDTAQEVFVRVFQSLHAGRFRATSVPFSTWLFQVARHAAIDVLRKRRRRPLEVFSALADGGETLPATGRTADTITADRDTGEQIAAAVARLPEDQRTAFLLAEFEGFSIAEIAAVMNTSGKSVEARLYRARKWLRTHLAYLL
jgi:RNA polymerase sigma-70 factor (ECF subfamily)